MVHSLATAQSESRQTVQSRGTSLDPDRHGRPTTLKHAIVSVLELQPCTTFFEGVHDGYSQRARVVRLEEEGLL